MATRKNAGRALQGISMLGILYYLMFGDPSRLPVEWLGTVPHNPLTSSAAFLFWILLIYLVEGALATEYGDDPKDSPVRRGLGYYLTYWRVDVPLVIVGHFFFAQIENSPLYCPMFLNLGFLNLSRAAVALTNNIHEGTWLISSIAICAFCASLYFKVREKKGDVVALLVLGAGVLVQSVLYWIILPFMYHKIVFRLAAVAGPVAYMTGFMLFKEPTVRNLWRRSLRSLEGSRTMKRIAAPFSCIGKNWLAFWIVQFYMACYYFNIPSTVYQTTGSATGSYLVIAALTVCAVLLLNWAYRQFADIYRSSKTTLLALAALLALPFLLRLALEVSMDSYAQFAHVAAQQWPRYAMINVCAILCLVMLLRALTGRWTISGIVVTVLLTALGIVNHYVMKYHGTLVTVEDLQNIQTAANVVGSYDMSVDEIAGKVLLFGGGGLACCAVVGVFARKARRLMKKRQRLINRGVCLSLSAFTLFMFYFSADPLVSRQDNIWSWGSLYAKIGFFSGTVESTMANLAFSVLEPDGYSSDEIARLSADARNYLDSAEKDAAAVRDLPDIIMILNETWYDLDNYIDTGADVDYMANYRALDNAIKGFTEVPVTGGGTNGTEYEMLTGNSMSLVNAYAPFNRLNFTHTVTLPSYLKSLGYATIAAHPHESQNYHRGASWDQMGFERKYFIDDFTDLEFYANRWTDHRCTDISALNNAIRFYNEMPGDQPRFVFLATMQNHGGWTRNTPDQALVRSNLQLEEAVGSNQASGAAPGSTGGQTSGQGDQDGNPAQNTLSSKVNEFLSCIKLTDDMIPYMQQYFTEQYRQNGRRVVICMCGDHSPSFITSLSKLCKWEDDTLAERKGRSTPYFIWANYPLELDGLNLEGCDDMDLCCFMPTTLAVAGIPMSYYYQYLCDLRGQVSVFTNVGSDDEESETNRISFCDREGVVHPLDEASPLAQTMRDYMYMEYNLNGKGEAYEPALFLPAGVTAME